VQPHLQALRSARARDYAAFLAALQAAYDEVFGSSGYARNIISVWCYTGPLTPRLSQTSYSPWLSTYVATTPHHVGTRPEPDRLYRMSIRALGKVSLLYTGDITLRGRLLAAAQQHFKPERWRRIEFFQVPHHGAATSWLVKDAPSLTHSFSIFSSAYRGRLGHPQPEVVAYLVSRAPTFVHEFSGAHWGGTATWH
jgi:hypothetical protein